MISGDIEIEIDDDVDGNTLIASFAADSGDTGLPPKVCFTVQAPCEVDGIDSEIRFFFTVDASVLRHLCAIAENINAVGKALEG